MKQKTKRLICAVVSASLILPVISGMGFADESSSEPSGDPGTGISGPRRLSYEDPGGYAPISGKIGKRNRPDDPEDL